MVRHGNRTSMDNTLSATRFGSKTFQGDGRVLQAQDGQCSLGYGGSQAVVIAWLVCEVPQRTVARLAHKQDGCTGAFFEGRYKSIAILDEEAPIEDRRKQGALREGMREGFTLGQYLMLVDYTSRFVRDGKASVTAEVESIIMRLGSSAESWGARMLKLSGARLLGRFMSASRDRLREIAQRIGVRHLANVG